MGKQQGSSGASSGVFLHRPETIIPQILQHGTQRSQGCCGTARMQLLEDPSARSHLKSPCLSQHPPPHGSFRCQGLAWLMHATRLPPLSARHSEYLLSVLPIRTSRWQPANRASANADLTVWQLAHVIQMLTRMSSNLNISSRLVVRRV